MYFCVAFMAADDKSVVVTHFLLDMRSWMVPPCEESPFPSGFFLQGKFISGTRALRIPEYVLVQKTLL